MIRWEFLSACQQGFLSYSDKSKEQDTINSYFRSRNPLSPAFFSSGTQYLWLRPEPSCTVGKQKVPSRLYWGGCTWLVCITSVAGPMCRENIRAWDWLAQKLSFIFSLISNRLFRMPLSLSCILLLDGLFSFEEMLGFFLLKIPPPFESSFF